MRYTVDSRVVQALHNPHAVAERLATWSEAARRAGRIMRADQLLIAAWEAFDMPSVSFVLGHWPDASCVQHECMEHAA